METISIVLFIYGGACIVAAVIGLYQFYKKYPEFVEFDGEDASLSKEDLRKPGTVWVFFKNK